MNKFLHHNIFLIDGVGGLSSALSLGLVLPYFQVGLSETALAALALAALACAAYSLGCFAFKKKGRPWLRVIIGANLLYCVITALTVIIFLNDLTGLGITYFLIEILLILALVRLELQISKEV